MFKRTKSILLRNVVPRQGTETPYSQISVIFHNVLRNVVPRQGTETCFHLHVKNFLSVPLEKCSSPTGDGNINMVLATDAKQLEKCSSPTGDGNNESLSMTIPYVILRNVVPRQGTETISAFH